MSSTTEKSVCRSTVRLCSERHDEGVALITALAMLMIFALLGTGYISFMTVEQDRNMFELRKLRAQHLAIGGVNAAIGEIRTAIRSGSVPEDNYSFEIPVYVRDADSPVGFSGVPQTVSVRIEDEAAGVNLNHAPRELLEALGMERNQVRMLKNSLPKGSVPSAKQRRWLARVDGLRSRGILEAREYRALDKTVFTVYSAVNQENPSGFINLNSASPKVLAAIFNMTADEAATLARTRPFTSWSDVVVKTGRDPSTYNVRPAATAPHTMPRELSLSSACYRIACEATVEPYGRGGPRARSLAEAVVVFKSDGTHEVRFWSESGSGEQNSGDDETTSASSAAQPTVESLAPGGQESQEPPEAGSEIPKGVIQPGEA